MYKLAVIMVFSFKRVTLNWIFPAFFVCLLSKASLQAEDKVRLVGGHSSESGRVEVYHNGTWGTVCDEGWDLRDGHVVCRMLGYKLATQVKCCAAYGQGTGPIWLGKLNCNGRERSLINCSNSGWGVHYCNHSEDAGVTCSNRTKPDSSHGIAGWWKNLGTTLQVVIIAVPIAVIVLIGCCCCCRHSGRCWMACRCGNCYQRLL